MSVITIASDASLDIKSAQHVPFISALVAGEDLDAVAPCYIKSDGKVYMSISTQATISGVADFIGFTPDTVTSGMPVTLFGQGARFNYSTGMTPGAYLWIAATKGKLDTTKVAANDTPTALAISATDVVVLK